MNDAIHIRFDGGRSEYVINFNIPNLREFEASGTLISDAFQDLTEQLEAEGI